MSMVMTMAKKKPTMDRSAMRFVPIPQETLESRATDMIKWAGIMLAAAHEMTSIGMESIDFDGHGKFLAACDTFEMVARAAKGQVEAMKL